MACIFSLILFFHELPFLKKKKPICGILGFLIDFIYIYICSHIYRFVLKHKEKKCRAAFVEAKYCKCNAKG